MRPRSLVVDLYGDYIRHDGGEARLQTLVELLAAFDVPAPTTRVVMSRLRAEGWLESVRRGRTTTYQLTDAGWRLLDVGRRRIFERERRPWDGQWRMVIYHVPESDRATRDRLRKRLMWLGFGALAPSTWLSPHDRLQDVESEMVTEAARVDLLVARSRGPVEDAAMAARCWDLPALQAEFLELRESYLARLARYAASPPRGVDALVERVGMVADYRRLPFRDPDLPTGLLPGDWAGRDVHALFLEAYQALKDEADGYYREVVHRTGGAGGDEASVTAVPKSVPSV